MTPSLDGLDATLVLLNDPDPLLTPAAVAAWLGVSPKTLEQWRGAGGGPLYVRLSKKVVRYRRADVEAFIAERVKAHTAAP